VQQLFKAGNKDMAEFADTVCNQLDQFRDNVKNSEYGFHPKNQSLTEDIEEDFTNIIKADASMVYFADKILDTCSGLQLKVLSGDEIKPDIMNILSSLKALKEIFQQRKDFVSGVSQILKIKDPSK